MLTIAGFFTSDADRAKAADININLWLGVFMLLLGIFFLVWARLIPQKPPEPNLTGTDRPMMHH
jgi:predicted transporter